MARIELVEVAHSYQEPQGDAGRDVSAAGMALRPLSMTWEDGGAYALLGPSGCGKTTLLNIISGLLIPTRGRLFFDGRDVTALAPQDRNIAQVFQFPVIYDTMTVFDNLAFPLRNRKWRPAEVRSRVHEIAEILDLSADLPRRAKGLTADAKQRISLGRGLVRPDVAAVLFDEPLTVIDPHVKWLLRRKLKHIHQQLKLSLIYVTHDQTEALTFADQIVVMSSGEVVQTGTPQQLFEAPAHRFVGHFIGTPGMNFLPCEWHGSAVVDGTSLVTASSHNPPAGIPLLVGIRPEHVEVAATEGSNRIPAQITSIEDQGAHLMVRIDIAGSAIWAKLRDTRARPQVGLTHVRLPAHHCALYANERRVP
jgi:glycerol transport system ATP-binding protein